MVFGWQPDGHPSPTKHFKKNCRVRMPAAQRAAQWRARLPPSRLLDKYRSLAVSSGLPFGYSPSRPNIRISKSSNFRIVRKPPATGEWATSRTWPHGGRVSPTTTCWPRCPSPIPFYPACLLVGQASRLSIIQSDRQDACPTTGKRARRPFHYLISASGCRIALIKQSVLTGHQIGTPRA